MANFIYGNETIKVELPDIYSIYTPELQALYPYAYITPRMIGVYYDLYIMTAPVVEAEDTGWFGFYGKSRRATLHNGDTEWGAFGEENDYSSGGRSTLGAIWYNHPVYGSDGTLEYPYIAPIPVGSAPEVEPKAFMNGWDIGQFVRAIL